MSGDVMQFPKTIEEFMEEYKVVDTEHVYINGTELVPIFLMKQWFEHIGAEPIRHGKLMRTEAYPHRLYCSECSKTLIPNEEICFEKNEFPKYCMWCGAKMEAKDEDY